MQAKHRTDRISLPVMQCDSGCGACCGPVMCHDWEYQRVQAHARKAGLVPLRQGKTCPWYQAGTCAVYEARPFACRLFGHVKNLNCERGHNTNITRAEELNLMHLYRRDGELNRFLHEAIGDGWGEELLGDLNAK